MKNDLNQFLRSNSKLMQAHESFFTTYNAYAFAFSGLRKTCCASGSVYYGRHRNFKTC